MVPVYPSSGGDSHSAREPSGDPCVAAGGSSSRLNLLLTSARWQHESWADVLPSLLEPMGISSLTAGSGRQASRVIAERRIHIAVVDLALPLEEAPEAEEGGARLLQVLGRLPSPPPTVVVRSWRGHRDDSRELRAILRAGAFAVVDRPRAPRELEILLDALRRCLGRHYQGRWPGIA